ncbi:hypothetical protein PR202_ga25485 [Eleusine coracana subsp. coracana]|uniref:Uncharacterized protein n=1 Tax=Eleusine coracana subsp. coracana TaxID=191504 RepID=A0AAV5DBA7_ELECO|nr:hypothetical protein PR202_ga25424 [Eleusine coracana subsp. coracana]GJN07640.1 hypothetical protein PR202_ga25485 [Eleusine coracana subsp. coracana]
MRHWSLHLCHARPRHPFLRHVSHRASLVPSPSRCRSTGVMRRRYRSRWSLRHHRLRLSRRFVRGLSLGSTWSHISTFIHCFASTALGGGVIQGTASEAVLVVLLAARDRALRKHGKTSLDKLVVYASDQTHSALQKACQIAGIFPENMRVVMADCDRNYAVAPEAVSKAISTDLSSGLIPFFVCATVGTTSSAAVDPLPELGQIAKAHDMWFHIDAAYAGSSCICPEYRHHLDGVEEADSFNMNAHKWFLTNFDCSLLWVKDRSYLIQSLSTNPEFLKNKASEANSVVDSKIGKFHLDAVSGCGDDADLQPSCSHDEVRGKGETTDKRWHLWSGEASAGVVMSLSPLQSGDGDVTSRSVLSQGPLQDRHWWPGGQTWASLFTDPSDPHLQSPYDTRYLRSPVDHVCLTCLA